MSRSSVICVDASLVVRFLVDPDNQKVHSLWDQWFQEGRVFVAPSLIHYEVLNALFQYERHGKLSPQATHTPSIPSSSYTMKLFDSLVSSPCQLATTLIMWLLLSGLESSFGLVMSVF